MLRFFNCHSRRCCHFVTSKFVQCFQKVFKILFQTSLTCLFNMYDSFTILLFTSHFLFYGLKTLSWSILFSNKTHTHKVQTLNFQTSNNSILILLGSQFDFSWLGSRLNTLQSQRNATSYRKWAAPQKNTTVSVQISFITDCKVTWHTFNSETKTKH